MFKNIISELSPGSTKILLHKGVVFTLLQMEIHSPQGCVLLKKDQDQEKN